MAAGKITGAEFLANDGGVLESLDGDGVVQEAPQHLLIFCPTKHGVETRFNLLELFSG